MKKSTSAKKSKSNPSSFTGVSLSGDLAEAFTKAKESLRAAGLGTDTLDEVSVTISLKALMGDHKDDTPGGHQIKDLPSK